MLVRRRSVLAVVPLLALALGVGALTAPTAQAVAPAAAPEPVSPLAGDPAVDSTPVFTWSAVPGALTYRFQVSTSPTFSTVITNATTTTYGLHATPKENLPSGTLYWHVAGLSPTGEAGPYSDPVEFLVSTATGPVLVSPSDATSLVYPADPPVLVWEPITGAKSYTVQLADTETFTAATSYTTANSQLALTEPVELGSAHYWRVKAATGTTTTTEWSQTWSFSVSWPDVPAPQAPASGASVTSLRLQWSAVPGSKNYEVEISTSVDFETGKLNLGTVAQNISGTQWSPLTALAPGAYYWRVRAKDTATGSLQHPGDWSEPITFTLAAMSPPTDLTPGLDVNQAGTIPFVSHPRLSWSGVSRAATYEIQIGTDQNFSDPSNYAMCTTQHTSLTPYFASNGTYATGGTCDLHFVAQQYFWRVRAVDVYPGAWSAIMAFFFDGLAPVVTGPANGAITSAPVLSWESVLGFNKYKVTITRGTTTKTFTTYANTFTPLAATTATFGGSPGDYVWAVQTVAANGDLGPYSPARGYTLVAPTEDPGNPSVLATIAPHGVASLDMPAFSWQHQDGASYYRPYYRALGGSVWIAMGATKGVLPAFTWSDEPLPAGTYEWMVEAMDAGSTIIATTAATPETFEVAELERAQYSGPTDCIQFPGCATHNDVPTLSWEIVPGTFKYRVHLAIDPGFVTEIAHFQTQLTSITFLGQLPDNQANQAYYWFVQPCKSETICGPFTDGFQTQYEQSFKKATPAVQLVGPADAAMVGDEVNFSWEDYFPTGVVSSPVAGAKQYHLQVATREDFAGSSIVDDKYLDQISYTPFEKEYKDDTYYWRVQAVDAAGQKLTFSEVRSFVKDSLQPVLHDVTTTTPLPTLTWDALPYSSGYLVEVFPGLDNTTGTPLLTSTTRLPAFTPIAGLAKGGYTWRVAKKDPSAPSNTGPYSTPSSFTVAQGAPTLLLPGDNASIPSDDLLFSWELSTGKATSFKFESSTSAAFATVFESAVLPGTTWASTKKYADGVKHYWRVSTLDAQNNTLATSTVRAFTKDSAAPTAVSSLPLKDLPLTGVATTVAFSEAVTGVNTSTFKLHLQGQPGIAVPGTIAVSSDKKSATFTPSGPLVPGRWYTVSLASGITDLVGNPLVPKTFDRRAALVVDSSNTAVREYWDVDTSTYASAGLFATSRLGGTSMSLGFTGTSVQLLGTKGPLGGYANVYVDGVLVGKPSFYRSSTAYQQLLLTKSGLTNTAHTIKVVVVGGTPPTGSKGTYVYVDAFKVGTSLYQEGTARQAFNRVVTGTTTSYQREYFDPSGDTSAKPEYRLVFDGSGIDILVAKCSVCGKARIYLDGVAKADIDTYAAATSANVKAHSVTGLDPAKVHTLRMVFLGTKATSSTGYAVQLDGFVVK